ncbi:hypothetical protein LZ30DRAFT_602218 [Colletotrichum cereale]|nr:hypothetical protein LZ30DRAFT_602218 [Colletotrichum cereale]
MRLLPGAGPFVPESRWRRGAFFFAVAAFVTFAVNLSFIAWATGNRGRTLDADIGTISEDACSKIKRWNTAIHVVINIISTILLSGSNYCMQCLIAPTRPEIDQAHSQLKWLDIGVPSIRNFGRISNKRKILWLLLATSSFPLHLLFNSVVFSSLSINEYPINFVNKNFIEQEDINTLPGFLRTEDLSKLHAALQAGGLDRLSLGECINEYGTAYQSSRGNLLVVVSDDITDDQLGRDYNSYNPRLGGGSHASYYWILDTFSFERYKTTPKDELLTELKRTPEDWKLFDGKPLKECYSQKTEEHCKLLFSNPLCWVVTTLNLLKCILMLIVAFWKDEQPLLTVGDAVASFLEEEDTHTINMCLASKSRIKQKHWDKIALPHGAKPQRKFAAASVTRWITCILLCLSAISACLVLLIIYGAYFFSQGVATYGFGEINLDTVMSNVDVLGPNADKLLFNVILANIPQVIMSLLYFNYNALLTSISLVTEWDRFGSEKKGLRVSSEPRGAQRETYFLQLPYRYSLPLAAFSGGLHWLISQSIFLVNLEVYSPDPDNVMNLQSSADTDITSCGWSPLGVLFVISAGVAMIVFLVASGWRRLRFGGIPVAGSCSAAISAACHPGFYEENAWEKPLRWGVVPEPESEPRHCSFSSQPTEGPVEGQLYL